MKFFLDTASLDEIIFWNKLKLVDGVTTNPSLLSKDNNDPITNLKKNNKNNKWSSFGTSDIR